MNPYQAAEVIAQSLTRMKTSREPRPEPWPKEKFVCPHCKADPIEKEMPMGKAFFQRTDCCPEARFAFAKKQLEAAYCLNTLPDEARACLLNAYDVFSGLTREQQRALKKLEATLKAAREAQAQQSTFNPRGYVPETKRPYSGPGQRTINVQEGR